ncbi:MAG: rhodanese-like domain-containing protein [Arcobacteraceae bacterium]
MKRAILIFLVLVVSAFSQVDFSKANLYKADINSQTAFLMQQKGAILIDVRTKEEFKFSRPKGAINIPVFNEKFGQRVFNENFVEQIDYALKGNHDKEVILICRSGSRTKLAANLLANDGFSNVYNIKEGFTYDWIKTDLPVEK